KNYTPSLHTLFRSLDLTSAFLYFNRGITEMFGKASREIARAPKSNSIRYLGDGHLLRLEQVHRPCETVFADILVGRLPRMLFEFAVELGTAHAQAFGQCFDSKLFVPEVGFYLFKYFPYQRAVFDLFAGGLRFGYHH